jgi:hypothetical protein
MQHFAAANGIPLPAKHEFRKAARVSLYDLIRYTPMTIRENRKHNCRLFFYTTEYFKRPGKRGLRIFAYKTGCNKHTYVTQLGFVDWRRGLKSTIWCHCSCDYFKYNVEYVLAQLGSSELVFSWNQPPQVRNPDRVPHACKHILLAVDDALKRSRQFAKIDSETELQDVKIEDIKDKSKEFKDKDLQDEKRFRELQTPKRPVFKPFTQPDGGQDGNQTPTGPQKNQQPPTGKP